MAAAMFAEIYAICMAIVGVLLFWDAVNGSNSSSEQWLRWVLWAFLINFACDFCFGLFNQARVLPGVMMPASWLFKTLCHVFLCAGVYAWCGFANIQNHGKLFSVKRTRRLTLLLILPPVAAALVNPWTRWLFDFTAAGEYAPGWLYRWEMAYLFGLSLAFGVPLLVRLPHELEPARRSHMKVTASFALCMLLGWALSHVGEKVPVFGVCVALDMMCLYMDTSSQQVSMDKLTQVNNRQNLLSFLEYKIKSHEESLFLLMIDVDYFKCINDTYGHLEGDEALILVSTILKKSCAGNRRRPFIGRYGGDEFIIVLEGTRDEADQICGRIRERLRQYCAAADKPYDLTLSIGVARWQPDMNPQTFISAADAQLYEIKRARTKC